MTILKALGGHYDRLAANGKAPQYGYSSESVSFVIVLSREGEAVDVMDLRDMSGSKPRPTRRLLPQPVPRSVNIASNFLWDKTAYSLGVMLDKEKKTPILAKRGEHEHFKNFHLDLLADTNDEGMKALRTFLDNWQPENYRNLPNAGDILDTNIVFRLDGEQCFIHERAAARDNWLAHLAGQDRAESLCLVTGEFSPMERLHPKIKGVRGAQSSGAAMVSFNLDAFESFGKTQGANAPISERATFAYTTALNTLLARDSGKHIQIGDATTVFWAEAVGDDAAAKSAEGLFTMLSDPPTDAQEAAKVSDKLSALAEGRPLADVEPDVDCDTRFYILGLAPNAARLSVRFWFQGTIGAIAQRITEHWRDLRLEPEPWPRPPSARRLLYETALQRKAENIPPSLGGALMRAILTGSKYPQTLLSTIIMRLRLDRDVSGIRVSGARVAIVGARVAIVKACIRRAERLSNPEDKKEDCLVKLDKHSDNIAYNLGRLFAAYAYAEKSYGGRNATIRDKYMGAASATPRRVFPILMRGYEHNRAGLAKSGGMKKGAGVITDKEVGDIIDQLPGSGELPTSLTLEDQARFFVGYYHQERAFYRKSNADGEQDQANQPEEE